jgi:hypothetical protein
MSITLTSAFTETTVDGFTVCYDSSQVAVLVLKEPFILADGFGDLTLEEYADVIYRSNSEKQPTKIFNEDGLTCLEFVSYSTEAKADYKYFGVMYKTDDAFWFIQFACLEKNYEENRAHFIECGKSVTFDA